MNRSRCVCIIPARHGSTRLKAKPLIRLGGKPLIQHVWERAREAGVFSRILIATDSPAICRVVVQFGGEAVMTARRLKSGTDRVAAVARHLSAPLIMNLQGDEPFISARGLAALTRAMRRDPACPMGTLARRTPWTDICANPHAVKIVTDHRGRALYFSRAPVPFNWTKSGTLLHHLGAYCYRRTFLLKIARWPQTTLERQERLEQLRVLEYGIHPKVVVTTGPALSIDTQKDLQRAHEWLRERGKRLVTS